MKRGFLNRPGALSIDHKVFPAGIAEERGVTKFKSNDSRLYPVPTSVYESWKNAHWEFVPLPSSEALPPDTQQSMCLLLECVKENILALPSFPGPPIVSSNPALYRIGSSPDAGLGMFAMRDIKAGEIVLIERPLLVFPLALPPIPNFAYPDGIFEKLASAMSDRDRAFLMSLSSCKGPTVARIQGIARTNSFGIGGLPGHNTPYAALYRDISRINHSCCQNVDGLWDVKTFTFTVRALCPILAGEQIFISYCIPTLPRSERRSILSLKYKFTCTCHSCNLPDAESAASDNRRKMLKSLQVDPAEDVALEAWLYDLSLPDDHITKKGESVWANMEDECCVCFTEAYLALARRTALAYCALGDKVNTRAWAKKVAALGMIMFGNDGGWMKAAEEPQGGSWWQVRVNHGI